MYPENTRLNHIRQLTRLPNGASNNDYTTVRDSLCAFLYNRKQQRPFMYGEYGGLFKEELMSKGQCAKTR